MKLIDGNELDVVDPGKYNNNESGPDFFISKIKTGQITWVGSIEIHVNSSDWFRHNHHLDVAYNNVILHVVYNYDKPVKVNGRELPVLELKTYIDKTHFEKFKIIDNDKKTFDIPCKRIIKKYEDTKLQEMIELALNNRIKRKVSEIEGLNIKKSEDVFYFLIARAFGTKVNQQPFEQICHNYPRKYLSTLSTENKINQFIKKIISTEHLFYWKTKGLYHSSSPEKRMLEFLNFISLIDFSYPFWDLPTSMILEYFKSKFAQARLKGKIISTNLLINAISIFLYWQGTKLNDTNILSKSIRILELIPSENNVFIRKWMKLQINPQNAKESQALLEIYQQFCTRKKCLECSIGINFLNS